jgi:cytochrome c oxidase subunit 3
VHDNSTSSPFGTDIRQRGAAAQLGIWLFLATEILFFGGLFTSYAIYRLMYPEAFTIAARETALWLGTTNTAILLTSSFAIALAVKIERSNDVLSGRLVIATILFGLAFLVVKVIEYAIDIENGLVPGSGFSLAPAETQIFWALYWLMTGVHALHVIAGGGVLTTIYLLKRSDRISPDSASLEVGALYWHLVDVIWIFLYPILYLVGRGA